MNDSLSIALYEARLEKRAGAAAGGARRAANTAWSGAKSLPFVGGVLGGAEAVATRGGRWAKNAVQGGTSPDMPWLRNSTLSEKLGYGAGFVVAPVAAVHLAKKMRNGGQPPPPMIEQAYAAKQALNHPYG